MPNFDADPVAALGDLRQRLRRVPLTETQFAAALDPVLAAFAGIGLYITINVSDRDGTPQKTYGSSPGPGLTDGTTQQERADTDTALIEIRAERRADVDSGRMRELFTRILTVLQPLLASHWGARDALTFVFNADQGERFRAAIQDAVSANTPVALVAFDLDHFKLVNDTHGHPAGNAVLREFGRRLRAQFADVGLIGRFGGEEFTVVWLDATLEPLIAALTAFRREQESEAYQAIDRTNTCSIGVAVFPEFVAEIGDDPYKTLNQIADEALYAAKEAGRNRTRVTLLCQKSGRPPPITGRSRFLVSSLSDVRGVVDQLLGEIGVDVSEGTQFGWPSIGRRELVEVIVTALCGNALVGEGPVPLGSRVILRSSASGAATILALQDGTSTVELPVPADVAAEISLGEIWRDRARSADGVPRYVANGISLSPFVTIAVGADNLTRPGIEWSGAVIPAVQAVLANPNARVVMILGDEATARRTITMLTQLVDLSDDDWRVTRRLGLTPPVLREFLGRGITVRVVSPAGEAFLDLVQQLLLGSGPEVGAAGEPRAVAAEAEQRARFSILAPRDTALSDLDGMRVTTLADAYPRVIHLLRSASLNRHSDFMRREFVELTAFKVAISHPTVDPIPDYWSDDADELRAYHNQQFRSPTGLFGSRLQTWGDGESQITKAVAATVDALTSGVASRRILFAVPRPSDDWRSPVGLISASVLPRIHGDQRRLDFLWMWRTVEALVGFPFSAYGSIHESTFLLDKVNAALRARGEREAICGELIYFAASLHFFHGSGDAEIARTVVRDAIR